VLHDFKCGAYKGSYHGQVDPETRMPDGLGLLVYEGGNILEGSFKQGKISYPQLKTLVNGSATAELKTANK